MHIQEGSQTARSFLILFIKWQETSHPGGLCIHSSRAIKLSHDCNQSAWTGASAAHLQEPASVGFFFLSVHLAVYFWLVNYFLTLLWSLVTAEDSVLRWLAQKTVAFFFWSVSFSHLLRQQKYSKPFNFYNSIVISEKPLLPVVLADILSEGLRLFKALSRDPFCPYLHLP